MRTKIILILFCLPGLLCTQTLNTARLDTFFDILEANNRAMGSLALTRNGKVLYKRSVGFCSLSATESKKCSEHTRYRIGSISKMFTAVMTLQLIEEGKLKEETRLSDFFPRIPNAEKISIRQMLHHRSGLRSFTSDSTYTRWLNQPKTKEQLLSMMEKSSPVFKPGERAEYSNSNFVLLGYIIEKITSRTYQENLQSRITGKLKLENTYYGGKIDIHNNESYSYRYLTKWEKDTETDMSIPGGAGAIVSTPLDLNQFIEGLFQGKLLNEKSIGKMKNIEEGYGMGLLQFPFNSKKAFGHTGGIDGFHSITAYIPDDSLSVSYCANGEAFDINEIVKTVLFAYYNLPFELPKFANISLSEEDLERYSGIYSSKMMPLKITITRKEKVLFAQATGQSSFPLEATGRHKFKFDPARLSMEFDPDKNEMVLKQGGGVFIFTKE